MKGIRSSLLIILVSLPSTSFFCSKDNVLEKPHIILIMTDQHRGDALGSAGNDAVLTPHLDRLAAEGVRFRNGYTSTPSCTPARSALLTGLSPWHHGMLGYGRVARRYRYEMPRMLREMGYFTFGIGKMHWYPQKSLHGFHGTLVDESGRVEQDGFVSDYRDWFKLQAPGHNPDQTGIGWNENRFDAYQLDEGLHPTTWTGQTAKHLIEQYDNDRPLFLKVSFARPHSPYDPPQRYLDRYRDVDIPQPVIGEWTGEFDFETTQPSPAFGNFGPDFAVEARRHYYANISFIDDQVGEIIAALKQKGMYDNALILFTSDHGDMLGDHYHWRKTYAYQGSAHIPFLVRWPEDMSAGIERGTELIQPVELRDVLPTFMDAAGDTVPENMDGASLLSLIRDASAPWRPYIDLEHSNTYRDQTYWCAMTDGHWKYIWFFPTGTEQLFDLSRDPGELIDLAGDPAVEEDLVTWRLRMGQHLAERGEDFVKDGVPAKRTERLLYSPHYPDALEERTPLQYWRQESMEIGR